MSLSRRSITILKPHKRSGFVVADFVSGSAGTQTQRVSYSRGRDTFKVMVERDAFHRITNVAAIEDICNVRKLHDDKTPFMLAQGMFDAGSNVFETKRIVGVGA